MNSELERQLRKDLKRYKTLLADAQTLIDHLKTDVVNKTHMKQMKTKVCPQRSVLFLSTICRKYIQQCPTLLLPFPLG